MTTTLGKLVTLPLGAVVTDTGPAVVNGVRDEGVRVCVADTGQVFRVLARVVCALPETTRRASFDYRP